jgi:hypothetical protein
MTLGLQGQVDPRHFVIRILEDATATNGVPSSYAAAGVDVGAILDTQYGAKAWPTSCVVFVHTSAGSGTMTATIKLWGGVLGVGAAGAGKYGAAGTGSSSTSGLLNGGAAFDEHAADNINRLDVIDLPGVCRKWYAEVTAIGGTATAVTVDLIFPAVPL